MKAGRPAFVAESPVSFDDAYRLVLEMDGIPCYPTLADGASPVCPWEEPPEALAQRVLERGIHAAELIPNRNRPAVVDAYVAAFRDGRHHRHGRDGAQHARTGSRSSRAASTGRCRPRPRGRHSGRGPASWRPTSTCAASGRPGYVDGEGRLNPGFPDGETRIRWFAELGAELIGAASPAVAR